MPQFIQQSKPQINANYLQILEQQRQQLSAVNQQKRQEQAATLATTIDQYGGLQSAIMQAPDTAQQYLETIGMPKEQIANMFTDVWNGNVAQNQEYQARSAMALKEGLTPGVVQQPQQPQGTGSETSSAAATASEGKFSSGARTLGVEGDLAYPDHSSEWGDKSTISPVVREMAGHDIAYQTYLPQKVESPIDTLSEEDATALKTVFAPEAYQAELERARKENPNLSDEQLTWAIAQQAKLTQKDQEREIAVVKDTQALSNTFDTKIEGKSIAELEQNLLQDYGGTRTSAYMSGTYTGDLAREIMWDSLTPTQKKEYSSNKKVSGFEIERMPEQMQQIYQQKTALIDNMKRSNEVVKKEFQAALNVNPEASQAGQKFAATQTTKQVENTLKTNGVAERSWAALGENPNSTVQFFQRWEKLVETAPEIAYTAVPSALKTALTQAELEGKEASNTVLKAEAAKMKKLLGNPEYLDDYSDYELAKLKVGTNLLLLQQAAQQLQLMGGDGSAEAAQALSLLEAFTKVGNMQSIKGDKKMEELVNSSVASAIKTIVDSQENSQIAIELFGAEFRGFID